MSWSPCMSAHDPAVTLRQLVEHCDRAAELRGSMTWEEFRDDWRKQMLGERLVEVIGGGGEAAAGGTARPPSGHALAEDRPHAGLHRARLRQRGLRGHLGRAGPRSGPVEAGGAGHPRGGVSRAAGQRGSGTTSRMTGSAAATLDLGSPVFPVQLYERFGADAPAELDALGNPGCTASPRPRSSAASTLLATSSSVSAIGFEVARRVACMGIGESGEGEDGGRRRIRTFVGR